jgi:hypothetical protein
MFSAFSTVYELGLICWSESPRYEDQPADTNYVTSRWLINKLRLRECVWYAIAYRLFSKLNVHSWFVQTYIAVRLTHRVGWEPTVILKLNSVTIHAVFIIIYIIIWGAQVFAITGQVDFIRFSHQLSTVFIMYHEHRLSYSLWYSPASRPIRLSRAWPNIRLHFQNFLNTYSNILPNLELIYLLVPNQTNRDNRHITSLTSWYSEINK